MRRQLLGAGAFGLAMMSAHALAQDVAPPESCDYGTVHPSAPAETSEFAFLIGDYKISLHAWRGEDWSHCAVERALRTGRHGDCR